MRIKKLLSKKLLVGEMSGKIDFEVELKPCEDDKEFPHGQTKTMTYELHLPFNNATIFLDLYSNLTRAPDSYAFLLRFPELFYVNHFIHTFRIQLPSLDEGNHVQKKNLYKFSFSGPKTTGLLDTRKTLVRGFNLKEFGPETTLLINFTLTDTFASLLNEFESIPTEVIREALEKKKFTQQYSLGQMLKNETEFRDFTIIIGFSEFKVHKCVLASQSSVFAQMLTTDMVESRNSTLKISDLSEATVKSAIEFMYTGEVFIDTVVFKENHGEILAGLFAFAQKYNMTNLKWAMMSKCFDIAPLLKNRSEEKHRLIQTVSLHEPNMRDLDTFLAILGPYSVE